MVAPVQAEGEASKLIFLYCKTEVVLRRELALPCRYDVAREAQSSAVVVQRKRLIEILAAVVAGTVSKNDALRHVEEGRVAVIIV